MGKSGSERTTLHETAAYVRHALVRQLEQHGLVKELVQCDVVCQTLEYFKIFLKNISEIPFVGGS